MPNSAQGKSEKKTQSEDEPHLDLKTDLQIREALQLQLDVQRRLHEQLEIQRKLQLRIEEQGKQLKMLFGQQQKTSDSPLNSENLEARPMMTQQLVLKILRFRFLKGQEILSSLPR